MMTTKKMNETGVLDLNAALGVPYYRKLCSEMTAVYDKVRAELGLAGKPDGLQKSLSAKERYQMQVMSSISDLIAVVDGIRVVRALMNRRPPKNYLERHELSIADYMGYHYSSFLHRVSTALDVMKIVASDALQLGHEHRHCNWENLEGHAVFKSPGARTVITAYHKEFKSLIEGRHRHTHRGILEHEPLTELGSKLFTLRTARNYDAASLPLLETYLNPIYLNWQTKRVRSGIIAEMMQSEQRIFIHVRDLLNSFEGAS